MSQSHIVCLRTDVVSVDQICGLGELPQSAIGPGLCSPEYSRKFAGSAPLRRKPTRSAGSLSATGRAFRLRDVEIAIAPPPLKPAGAYTQPRRIDPQPKYPHVD